MKLTLSRSIAKHSGDIPKFTASELANLCGVLHQNIDLIEKSLNVRIKFEDNGIEVLGKSTKNVSEAIGIISALHHFASKPIQKRLILSLLEIKKDKKKMPDKIQLGRKTITARNTRQASYLDGIDKYDLNFAVGPAGTGKTYLAVAKAIELFEKGEVQRLIFVRPAVEAGEKLGFLPGDLVEKVLPFLRPIYDALYEMIGFKETNKLIENDVIEILPLAFMRGRTLNEAFIILDEAQNATIMQMKMFLTRIGFGSRTVVTGDMTQVDLPTGTISGLKHAVGLFNDFDGIKINTFTSSEVVRHPLVARIIDCYELNEKENKK